MSAPRGRTERSGSSGALRKVPERRYEEGVKVVTRYLYVNLQMDQSIHLSRGVSSDLPYHGVRGSLDAIGHRPDGRSDHGAPRSSCETRALPSIPISTSSREGNQCDRGFDGHPVRPRWWTTSAVSRSRRGIEVLRRSRRPTGGRRRRCVSGVEHRHEYPRIHERIARSRRGVLRETVMASPGSPSCDESRIENLIGVISDGRFERSPGETQPQRWTTRIASL